MKNVGQQRGGARVDGWRAALATSESRTKLLRRALEIWIFAVIPAMWCIGLIATLLTTNLSTHVGYDLKVAFLPAAHAVIHGASPYPALNDPVLAHQSAYVYPPFVAFVVAPLTAISTAAATFIGIVGFLLLVPVILWLVGVRDWRCYGVVMGWGPVFNAAQNVNVSLPIALLLALAWRYRRSSLTAGILLGTAVAAKLFVWPLFVWPIAVRRWRTLVIGFAAGALLALGSWAVIGFKGLGTYPKLLRLLTSYEEAQSYSISGALRVVGVGVVPARAVALVVVAVLLLACLRFGRQGDERRALAAATLAALASTPILWQHYLVLLLVPLAICRPRLSVAWFAPLVLWAAPFRGNGMVLQTLLVPAVCAFVGAVCLLGSREGEVSAYRRKTSPVAGDGEHRSAPNGGSAAGSLPAVIG